MPIVTLFGGSGFIGRYVARKLAKRGWRVRVAVRRPNAAIFLRPYGDVGQVEAIQANIRDEDSTARAIRGADAVINLVGILYNTGKQRFDAVHAEGAARIARLCAAQGVPVLVHVSAIGADPAAEADYLRSKGEGEAAIREHMPSATILRPSVLFGPEDEFFNRFAAMARLSPVMPLIGGAAKFQPVYVDDVAEAVVRSVEQGAARGQTYELGGSQVVTLRQVHEILFEHIQRKRFLLPVPFGLARIGAWVFEQMTKILGIPPLLTRDQLTMLEGDTIVAEGAKTLADLGINPKSMEAVLPSYLYRFRPYGQYARTMPQR